MVVTIQLGPGRGDFTDGIVAFVGDEEVDGVKSSAIPAGSEKLALALVPFWLPGWPAVPAMVVTIQLVPVAVSLADGAACTGLVT